MALLHPRIITKRARPLTPKQIRDRANRFTAGQRSGVWIDPFPDIPGTKPEKMVYAAFMQLRIPFQFQEWFHLEIADLEQEKWLRPDFIIPAAKILILVQGNYFHTQADQIAKDSLQFALYEMAGWTPLAWWEYDIESRLVDLIANEPRLVALEGTGPPLPHVAKWYDDLKGLRKANQKRRKPFTHKPVTVKVSRKKQLRKKGLF